ncbi:xylulokinase [Rhodobium gokarnense]|uniref:Xylulokinase n=1 Tax=Rhodobium gokarnense TaxID=364296 RepID=A0ABT3H632_9HYPH|nr:FGGY-family carbohydrate kinase [Rhodobium gokarnense]MCW2305853.1 xylulokinase [Rhodobium gokarnense]
MNILAIDLGGSALKARLYDGTDRILASARLPAGFSRPDEVSSEQDPDEWWRLLEAAVAEIAETARTALADTGAVAICGMTRTQVFLDEAGNPIRPAIGFRDRRAERVALEAREKLDPSRIPEAANLNAYHPAARLAWLKDHEPDAAARLNAILEPKDYLTFRLTGEKMTDRISEARLIASYDGGPASLAAALGLPDVLPPIGQPWDRVGTVREGLPGALGLLAGATVCCGSHDTWSAVAGIGAMNPGSAYCISGSSEVFGLMTDRPASAEGLITLDWGDIWHIGGPGLNGANVLDWLLDRIGLGTGNTADAIAALLAEPPSPRPLLFHPFLFGERVPFWDENLAAAFYGLSSEHGRGDMVRAAMEGIAMVNRRTLELAESAAGIRANEVFLAGGGARVPEWPQIRADMLNRPVIVSEDPEAGLMGCLALARVAGGRRASLAEAATALAHKTVRFDPSPDRRERMDLLYELFLESFDTVTTISRKLTGLASGRPT